MRAAAQTDRANSGRDTLYQLSLILSQEIEHGLNADEPGDRRRLIRLPQQLVMNELLPQFHDVEVAVVQFPELPVFERARLRCFFSIHSEESDGKACHYVRYKPITVL